MDLSSKFISKSYLIISDWHKIEMIFAVRKQVVLSYAVYIHTQKFVPAIKFYIIYGQIF